MRIAILDIFGLNTPITSDGCGLRPLVEKLAEKLGAEDYFATWDSAGMLYPVNRSISRLRDIGFDFIIGIGHSHGGDALEKALEEVPDNSVELAVFLDKAPVGNPMAWTSADASRIGRPFAPPAARQVRTFYQRKQTPLCGVPYAPRADGSVKNVLVGGQMPRSGFDCGDEDLGHFNLGHSEMCADQRIHDRIELAIMDAITSAQHAAFQRGGK